MRVEESRGDDDQAHSVSAVPKRWYVHLKIGEAAVSALAARFLDGLFHAIGKYLECEDIENNEIRFRLGFRYLAHLALRNAGLAPTNNCEQVVVPILVHEIISRLRCYHPDVGSISPVSHWLQAQPQFDPASATTGVNGDDARLNYLKLMAIHKQNPFVLSYLLLRCDDLTCTADEITNIFTSTTLRMVPPAEQTSQACVALPEKSRSSTTLTYEDLSDDAEASMESACTELANSGQISTKDSSATSAALPESSLVGMGIESQIVPSLPFEPKIERTEKPPSGVAESLNPLGHTSESAVDSSLKHWLVSYANDFLNLTSSSPGMQVKLVVNELELPKTAIISGVPASHFGGWKVCVRTESHGRKPEMAVMEKTATGARLTSALFMAAHKFTLYSDNLPQIDRLRQLRVFRLLAYLALRHSTIPVRDINVDSPILLKTIADELQRRFFHTAAAACLMSSAVAGWLKTHVSMDISSEGNPVAMEKWRTKLLAIAQKNILVLPYLLLRCSDDTCTPESLQDIISFLHEAQNKSCDLESANRRPQQNKSGNAAIATIAEPEDHQTEPLEHSLNEHRAGGSAMNETSAPNQFANAITSTSMAINLIGDTKKKPVPLVSPDYVRSHVDEGLNAIKNRQPAESTKFKYFEEKLSEEIASRQLDSAALANKTDSVDQDSSQDAVTLPGTNTAKTAAEVQTPIIQDQQSPSKPKLTSDDADSTQANITELDLNLKDMLVGYVEEFGSLIPFKVIVKNNHQPRSELSGGHVSARKGYWEVTIQSINSQSGKAQRFVNSLFQAAIKYVGTPGRPGYPTRRNVIFKFLAHLSIRFRGAAKLGWKQLDSVLISHLENLLLERFRTFSPERPSLCTAVLHWLLCAIPVDQKCMYTNEVQGKLSSKLDSFHKQNPFLLPYLVVRCDDETCSLEDIENCVNLNIPELELPRGQTICHSTDKSVGSGFKSIQHAAKTTSPSPAVTASDLTCSSATEITLSEIAPSEMIDIQQGSSSSVCPVVNATPSSSSGAPVAHSVTEESRQNPSVVGEISPNHLTLSMAGPILIDLTSQQKPDVQDGSKSRYADAPSASTKTASNQLTAKPVTAYPDQLDTCLKTEVISYARMFKTSLSEKTSARVGISAVKKSPSNDTSGQWEISMNVTLNTQQFLTIARANRFLHALFQVAAKYLSKPPVFTANERLMLMFRFLGCLALRHASLDWHEKLSDANVTVKMVNELQKRCQLQGQSPICPAIHDWLNNDIPLSTDDNKTVKTFNTERIANLKSIAAKNQFMLPYLLLRWNDPWCTAQEVGDCWNNFLAVASKGSGIPNSDGNDKQQGQSKSHQGGNSENFKRPATSCPTIDEAGSSKIPRLGPTPGLSVVNVSETARANSESVSSHITPENLSGTGTFTQIPEVSVTESSVKFSKTDSMLKGKLGEYVDTYNRKFSLGKTINVKKISIVARNFPTLKNPSLMWEVTFGLGSAASSRTARGANLSHTIFLAALRYTDSPGTTRKNCLHANLFLAHIGGWHCGISLKTNCDNASGVTKALIFELLHRYSSFPRAGNRMCRVVHAWLSDIRRTKSFGESSRNTSQVELEKELIFLLSSHVAAQNPFILPYLLLRCQDDQCTLQEIEEIWNKKLSPGCMEIVAADKIPSQRDAKAQEEAEKLHVNLSSKVMSLAVKPKSLSSHVNPDNSSSTGAFTEKPEVSVSETAVSVSKSDSMLKGKLSDYVAAYDKKFSLGNKIKIVAKNVSTGKNRSSLWEVTFGIGRTVNCASKTVLGDNLSHTIFLAVLCYTGSGDAGTKNCQHAKLFLAHIAAWHSGITLEKNCDLKSGITKTIMLVLLDRYRSFERRRIRLMSPAVHEWLSDIRRTKSLAENSGSAGNMDLETELVLLLNRHLAAQNSFILPYLLLRCRDYDGSLGEIEEIWTKGLEPGCLSAASTSASSSVSVPSETPPKPTDGNPGDALGVQPEIVLAASGKADGFGDKTTKTAALAPGGSGAANATQKSVTDVQSEKKELHAANENVVTATNLSIRDGKTLLGPKELDVKLSLSVKSLVDRYNGSKTKEKIHIKSDRRCGTRPWWTVTLTTTVREKLYSTTSQSERFLASLLEAARKHDTPSVEERRGLVLKFMAYAALRYVGYEEPISPIMALSDIIDLVVGILRERSTCSVVCPAVFEWITGAMTSSDQSGHSKAGFQNLDTLAKADPLLISCLLICSKERTLTAADLDAAFQSSLVPALVKNLSQDRTEVPLQWDLSLKKRMSLNSGVFNTQIKVMDRDCSFRLNVCARWRPNNSDDTAKCGPVWDVSMTSVVKQVKRETHGQAQRLANSLFQAVLEYVDLPTGTDWVYGIRHETAFRYLAHLALRHAEVPWKDVEWNSKAKVITVLVRELHRRHVDFTVCATVAKWLREYGKTIPADDEAQWNSKLRGLAEKNPFILQYLLLRCSDNSCVYEDILNCWNKTIPNAFNSGSLEQPPACSDSKMEPLPARSSKSNQSAAPLPAGRCPQSSTVLASASVVESERSRLSDASLKDRILKCVDDFNSALSDNEMLSMVELKVSHKVINPAGSPADPKWEITLKSHGRTVSRQAPRCLNALFAVARGFVIKSSSDTDGADMRMAFIVKLLSHLVLRFLDIYVSENFDAPMIRELLLRELRDRFTKFIMTGQSTVSHAVFNWIKDHAGVDPKDWHLSDLQVKWDLKMQATVTDNPFILPYLLLRCDDETCTVAEVNDCWNAPPMPTSADAPPTSASAQ